MTGGSAIAPEGTRRQLASDGRSPLQVERRSATCSSSPAHRLLLGEPTPVQTAGLLAAPVREPLGSAGTLLRTRAEPRCAHPPTRGSDSRSQTPPGCCGRRSWYQAAPRWRSTMRLKGCEGHPHKRNEGFDTAGLAAGGASAAAARARMPLGAPGPARCNRTRPKRRMRRAQQWGRGLGSSFEARPDDRPHRTTQHDRREPDEKREPDVPTSDRVSTNRNARSRRSSRREPADARRAGMSSARSQ